MNDIYQQIVDVMVEDQGYFYVFVIEFCCNFFIILIKREKYILLIINLIISVKLKLKLDIKDIF